MAPAHPHATGVAVYPALFYFLCHSGAKLKKAEFVFIVDRSGSMGGDRIDAAKEALLLLLKSLPVGCSFNVVSFGSSHQLLFPEGVSL